MDSDYPKHFLLGPLLAITIHYLVLQKLEVDHLALHIIVVSCVAYGALAYCISLASATLMASSFWVPLWLIIGAYRAFFHPLRRYPGPFNARLSKWWTVKQNWDTNLHFHRTQQQMQTDYGNYVRTGVL
jgi:hypothetical protein